MKEILARYGFSVLTKKPDKQTVDLEAANRRTIRERAPWPLFTFSQTGLGPFETRHPKRRVKDLIALSESALPSRAIRLIRNGITSMTWGLQPRAVSRMSKADPTIIKATDQVRRVLERPSLEEDDFTTFLGEIVEDLLIFDAGVWEYVPEPIGIPDNEVLSLAAVPAFTIARNRKWSIIGDPRLPRWVQVLEDGRITGYFLDTDIEYCMMRKRTFDPFGLSPLETALRICDALINLDEYQRNIASDAYPSMLIFLGDEADEAQLRSFRLYWENELRGRGTPGFYGGMGRAAPQVLPLKPAADAGAVSAVPGISDPDARNQLRPAAAGFRSGTGREPLDGRSAGEPVRAAGAAAVRADASEEDEYARAAAHCAADR